MKKLPKIISAAGYLLIGVLITATALQAQAIRTGSDVKTGIATLYARDPLAQSLCFADGGYGSIFWQNQVGNSCSDINFNGYKADGLSIGVEGGRQGVMIDLGTPDELQKIYGYEETVGKGQGFASLRLKDNKIYILKDRRARTVQELAEGEKLFQKPSLETQALPVKLGHVYLVRATDANDKNYTLYVKLLVIADVPNETVTFRWQIL